jgi:predicted amidohydrolase
MRLSLLQPRIVRGDIEHNLGAIQKLIGEAKGELLVLPEYALTGSLVLDLEADVRDWARRSAEAKALINVPRGKYLLINALAEVDGKLLNCCELLPTGDLQCKLFPDEPELDAGIVSGREQKVFELSGRRFKVVICSDLRHIDEISTDGLDFILFVYHFTDDNFPRVIGEVKNVSQTRGLPVLVSSLVSDKNSGFSSFVEGDVVVSLSGREGILEVEIG